MSPGVFRDNCILSRSSYRFSSSIKAGVACESLILLKRHYPSLIMNALLVTVLALVAATAAVPSGILGLGHGAVLAGAVGHGAVVAGPVAHGAVVAGPAVPGAVVAGPVAHGAVVAGPVAHGAVVAGPIAHGAVVAGPVAGVGLGLGLGVGIGHGVTVAGPGTVPATIAGPSGTIHAAGLWGPTHAGLHGAVIGHGHHW